MTMTPYKVSYQIDIDKVWYVGEPCYNLEFDAVSAAKRILDMAHVSATKVTLNNRTVFYANEYTD
jgi:hypothetical protein